MNNYLSLALGIVFAGLGGELFIHGTVGLARWLRVSAGTIAVTVTAFATSGPEMSVAITSALAGTPRIALGDALGSNVVNVALILGLSLLIAEIHSRRSDVRNNFQVALLAPLLVGILAVDGVLSRSDGVIVLAGFVAWGFRVMVTASRERNAAQDTEAKGRAWSVMAFMLLGAVLLVLAGRFIVSGANGIAEALGIGSFVIGAVVVALGTSVPELAVTLVSRIRGHHEIGLNAILGSNIFNGLFVIGVAAVICPISLVRQDVMTALAFGIVAVAMTLPSRKGYLQRWRGVVLLALYCGFVVSSIR